MSVYDDDPLSDSYHQRLEDTTTDHQAAARIPCPPDCVDGWRPVSPLYAEAHGISEMDARNTYYPCHNCQPGRFKRWAEGHFKPGHTCEACTAVVKGRATKAAR